eukprot:108091-Pyramimonas_sp.AAC.1
MERKLWSAAAQNSWNGQGLELVPDPFDFSRDLRKKRKHEWAGILRAVATGNSWTPCRMQECNLSQDSRCRRCQHVL